MDIDPQAVEVTKLSLLLKVLENQSQETIERQLKLFHERALPDLASNIKCGNSLIGPEFYDNREIDMFDEEERYRINAFDWNAEFPEIMKSGGFHAVIGNPPYIRIQALKEWAPREVHFYKRSYASAAKGNYDVYVVFVELGLRLLSERGRLGFIVPHKFLNARYGRPLRALLGEGKHVAEIVHFGDLQVFRGATNYTCLLFLQKGAVERCRVTKVADLSSWRTSGQATDGVIPAGRVGAAEWNFVVGAGAGLFNKLSRVPVKMGDIARIFVGLQTSADTVFLFKRYRRGGETSQVYSKELGREVPLESALLKPVVRSGNVGRFWATPTALVLFPYARVGGEFRLIPESQMKRSFPRTWGYLTQNKRLLAQREHGRFKGGGLVPTISQEPGRLGTTKDNGAIHGHSAFRVLRRCAPLLR